MLVFGDTNKSILLDGHFLRTMTNFIFDVSPSKPQNQKLIFEFEK